MALYVSETCINRDKNYSFGNSGVYEAFTDNVGKLYRSLQKEYGRCISGVFIDKKDGSVKKIGWVFLKRMKYEDAIGNRPEDHYLREVWVHLHTAPDEVTRVSHYLEMEA